ncbi:MAG: carbamoyltransferase HypF [Lentisphaeria bacterium]|nr:carbamoyltransferase HypF [Lentisphaeria bacterium]
MANLVKSIIYNIYGVVQGVGFRPFVHRIALAHRITGKVINRGSFVEVVAQGSDEDLQNFRNALAAEAPERANIVDIKEQVVELEVFEEFSILESQADKGAIFIPPDIATCHQCRKELFDPADRRYLHSFINCTACGPRLTILEALPYDRERTSMKHFPMCQACEKEYYSLASRRYDAQPVCCNDCGPEVYILGSNLRGGTAITECRKLLMQGKIAAIKGIGGFHLACDGRNIEAVNRLRELKHRPRKPFAVMMNNVDTVRKECILSEKALSWLDGCEKPILLLAKKSDCTLPDILAPGNPTLGVMLPYAPLQMLLFDYPDGVEFTDTLVMTSGNVSGAPICRTEEDAWQEISSFCDIILSHNRDIRLRADDSVMRLYNNEPYMIRRSRGFAPLPIKVDLPLKGEVLAIGGELKNAFCIAKDQLFYIAPHIGDMEDVRSNEALKDSVKLFSELLECKVDRTISDMHPGYHTTGIAGELSSNVLKIQHHYAHILSCMAENNYLEPVIGVAMDGTGYGSDGTIWGGEILLASPDKFERFTHIAPFPQAGGDAASREGWRIAVGLLEKYLPEQAGKYAEKLDLCSSVEYKMLSAMIKNNINTVVSTSVGRLFDGVSALLGIARNSTFEGDAAMSLEFAAQRWYEANKDDLPGIDSSFAEKGIMATDELFIRLANERIKGVDVGFLAYSFHKLLADMITASCVQARSLSNVNVCALSGGSFQNMLLLDLCREKLLKNGFRVLLHKLVPANDGGISLGQALYGVYNIKQF